MALKIPQTPYVVPFPNKVSKITKTSKSSEKHLERYLPTCKGLINILRV
jgi:hypothetical protein